MKTQMFLLAMLCLLLFVGCEKSDFENEKALTSSIEYENENVTKNLNDIKSKVVEQDDDTKVSASERENNMVVTITKTDGSVVTATVVKASADYVSSSYFTATLNPGQSYAQSYNATNMTFSEPDTKLKVTKSTNGGGVVVYENKSTATINIGTNVLSLNIQPGNISTTATSIVGEDPEGL